MKIGIGKEKRFSSVRGTPEGIDNFIRKIKLHGANLSECRPKGEPQEVANDSPRGRIDLSRAFACERELWACYESKRNGERWGWRLSRIHFDLLQELIEIKGLFNPADCTDVPGALFRISGSRNDHDR